MPNPYEDAQRWFSKIFEQIKAWKPEQQTSVLKKIAYGIKDIDNHCARGDKRADALEIDALNSIREHVNSWSEEEKEHANAYAVISVAQPNRDRGVTLGERHG